MIYVSCSEAVNASLIKCALQHLAFSILEHHFVHAMGAVSIVFIPLPPSVLVGHIPRDSRPMCGLKIKLQTSGV